jgi:hypothetical protein
VLPNNAFDRSAFGVGACSAGARTVIARAPLLVRCPPSGQREH